MLLELHSWNPPSNVEKMAFYQKTEICSFSNSRNIYCLLLSMNYFHKSR